MMDVNKLMRYLAYTLEIFIVFMLQQTPGLFPEIFGGRPVLLIPAAFTIAMVENTIPSSAFGVFAGMMMDYGFGGVLGFNALILMLICFLISILSRAVWQVNLGTAVLTCAWSIAVVILLGWVFQYLLVGYSSPLYALTNRYLPKYLYTLLFAPLIFLLNKGISGLIRTPE